MSAEPYGRPELGLSFLQEKADQRHTGKYPSSRQGLNYAILTMERLDLRKQSGKINASHDSEQINRNPDSAILYNRSLTFTKQTITPQ